MNKYIIKTALCAMLAVPVLSSCELDQYPEGSIPTEQSWVLVSDATAYNIGLLSNLRSAAGPGHTVVTEVLSDLFNATTCNGNPSYPTEHTWSFSATDFGGQGTWGTQYGLISNANNIINNIDKIQVGEGSNQESDLALLKEYKATAYFARAYAYTQLATDFCKNYDPATAETTLGLPLIKEVDVNYKPARSSLKETYDFIKEDLKFAKDLFTNHDNVDITAPNYNTVLALEARVSLLCQDYQNAIDCAEALMAKYPLASDYDSFSSMWTDDTGSELIYVPQQTVDERLDGYSDFIYATEVGGEGKFMPSYVPSQGLMDLYDSSDDDMRKDIYFAQTGIMANEIEDPNCYLLGKYPGNPALDKGQAAFEFYNMCKVFRVAEMYLIAAEAQYRLNGQGGSYLNTLRTARGAKALTSVDGSPITGAALFSEIKDEWAREMCGEGMRFSCLKRWNEGFTRKAPQSLLDGVLYLQQGATTLQVSADNVRWVWEIPQNDLETNPSLERNWPQE